MRQGQDVVQRLLTHTHVNIPILKATIAVDCECGQYGEFEFERIEDELTVRVVACECGRNYYLSTLNPTVMAEVRYAVEQDRAALPGADILARLEAAGQAV